MRWIAFAAGLVPLAASAALDQPQAASGVGLTNLVGVVVASCAVGWVVHQVLGASGKHTPEGAAMITAVAGLFGGPLLWYVLTRL